MKSLICNACGKPTKPDDKFCQHCGAPIKNTVPNPKAKTANKSKRIVFSALAKWILIALIVGLVVGWIRYWIGYYILLQGIVAGLLIPWVVKKNAKEQQQSIVNARFKIAIFLFFSFMIAQAIGFGLAQPVFDPIGWLARVWNGDTTESIFGVFSTGGVAHQAFSEGLSGGFWLFLTLFDMAFMFFFLLISLPVKTIKSKS